MPNASQPPGNSLRSKRPQEPLCSLVPVSPNTRDSCPKPPAQTCEAGLAGASRSPQEPQKLQQEREEKKSLSWDLPFSFLPLVFLVKMMRWQRLAAAEPLG